MVATFSLICVSAALILNGIDLAQGAFEFTFNESDLQLSGTVYEDGMHSLCLSSDDFSQRSLEKIIRTYLRIHKVELSVNEKAEDYKPSPTSAQGRTEIFDRACRGQHRGTLLGNVVIKCPDGNYISIMKCQKAGGFFGIQHLVNNVYRRAVWGNCEMCAE